MRRSPTTGTITGNVDLGTGANAFNNKIGGVFNSGAMVKLGAGNTLTNDGVLSPGGAGIIQTTTINGSLAQTSHGNLLVDVDMAAYLADQVVVDGTADLAGTILVNLMTRRGGYEEFDILNSSVPIALASLSVTSTAALHFSLFLHDPYQLWLEIGPLSATPLPAALPLFSSGLGLFGLLNWLRKRRKADWRSQSYESLVEAPEDIRPRGVAVYSRLAAHLIKKPVGVIAALLLCATSAKPSVAAASFARLGRWRRRSVLQAVVRLLLRDEPSLQ